MNKVKLLKIIAQMNQVAGMLSSGFKADIENLPGTATVTMPTLAENLVEWADIITEELLDE